MLRSAAGRIRSTGTSFVLSLVTLTLSGADFVAPRPLVGQTIASGPDFSEEWRWADFDVGDGLPEDPILDLVGDGDRVWAVSRNDLVWYDGFTWRSIPLPASPNAPSLALGRDGLLLVRGADTWPVQLADDPSAPPAFGEPATLSAPVYDPVVALDGRIFVSIPTASDGTLWRLGEVREGRLDVIPTPFPLHSPEGLAMVSTAEGLLVAASGGVLLLDRSGEWERVTESGAGAPRVAALSTDSGHLFRGFPVEERALLEWDRGGRLRDSGEGGNIVRDLVELRNGVTLALWDTGDLRMRGRDGVWRSLELPGSRLQGLERIWEEPDGDIWFSSRAGLHLFRRFDRRWMRLGFPFPALANRVNEIVRLEDGTTWIASGEGVRAYSPTGETREILEIGGVQLGAVTALSVDPESGDAWIGTGSGFRGVLRLTPAGEWQRFGADEGFDVPVHRLFPAPDGAVYATALSGGGDPAGLYRIDRDGVELLSAGVEVLSRSTYSLARDADGTLWVGGVLGLARRSPDGVWIEYPREEIGRINARIYDVALAPDSVLWYSTGNHPGFPLMCLDLRTGEIEPAGPGQPGTDGIWEIEVDDDGYVWTTGTDGVGLFRDGAWSLFGYTSGLRGTLAWPIDVGRPSVMVGTSAGLQLLNREAESAPAPVVLPGSARTEPGRAVFSWQARAWQGALAPQVVETRSRLDGGEWTPWSTRRQRVVEDARAGTRRLEVQARGLFGRAGETTVIEATVPLPLLLRPAVAVPGALLLAALLASSVVAGTRRRERDRAIRLSERRLRAFLDQTPGGILMCERSSGRIVDANRAACRLVGRSRREMLGIPLAALEAAGPGGPVLPDALEAPLGEDSSRGIGVEIRHADGSTRPVLAYLSVLPDTRDFLRVSLVDRTQEETALRRSRELEVQLHQSQKLEVVGQLTGGLAHDFNNLLTVVHGNLETVVDETRGPVRQYASEALQAAERGAELVRRLLAFSMRQPLSSSEISVAEVVREMAPLLDRTMGGSIRLTTRVDRGLPALVVDRAQLESALLNCCVNARDAMPGGGSIEITASSSEVHADRAMRLEVEAGDYVKICVADTGEGIPADVLDRVWEPFFTTKPVGRGSGLGLSQIYGFTRQSGGFAEIESVEGEGTRICMYFPSTTTVSTSLDPASASAAGEGR